MLPNCKRVVSQSLPACSLLSQKQTCLFRTVETAAPMSDHEDPPSWDEDDSEESSLEEFTTPYPFRQRAPSRAPSQAPSSQSRFSPSSRSHYTPGIQTPSSSRRTSLLRQHLYSPFQQTPPEGIQVESLSIQDLMKNPHYAALHDRFMESTEVQSMQARRIDQLEQELANLRTGSLPTYK